MEKIKLGKVVDIISGFAFDSRMFNNYGGTPLIRIRDVKKGYTETYTTQDYDKKYIIKNGDILIGMDGEFNIGKWKSKDALLNQRVCKIIPKEINADYLFYLLPKKLKSIESRTAFVTVKHLSVKQIENIEIDLIEMEQQKKVAKKLGMISKIQEIKQVQMEQLNELIKSKFVEMFENNNDVEYKKIIDICKSIVRGPFGSALKKDFFVEKNENTYKVYEQKNAINENWKLGTYYIDEQKYSELKRFECNPKDIIMSCSGTIGRFYQFPEEMERGIINQALLKFTINEEIVLSQYFIDYMKMNIDSLDTKGSGLQNLGSVSYIKEMNIPVPKIELQKRYLDFVKQVDKQKLKIQKSLEETQKIRESLMNKYFG